MKKEVTQCRVCFLFFSFFLFSNGICLKSNNTVKCVLSVIGNVHFEFGASFSRRFAFGSTIEFRLALIRDEIIVRPSHVNSFVVFVFFVSRWRARKYIIFSLQTFKSQKNKFKWWRRCGKLEALAVAVISELERTSRSLPFFLPRLKKKKNLFFFFLGCPPLLLFFPSSSFLLVI